MVFAVTVNKVFSTLVLLAASSTLVTPATAPPTRVRVGLYVDQITGLSLKENRYTADFYVWFRWEGDAVNPLETFELSNGKIESKTSVYETVTAGEHYAVCRINATISEVWDVASFPVDSHTLEIRLEDANAEEHKLLFVPDEENSGIKPEVRVPGWSIRRTGLKVRTSTIRSNFGDISLPTGKTSHYSQCIFTVVLKRPGWGYAVKILFGLFIAVLISFLALLIEPDDLEPRFGLGAGAVFSAVASEYVIASSLPETNVITLADMLHIAAFGVIFLTIAVSVCSHRLYSAGYEDRARLVDRYAIVLLPLAYFGFSLYRLEVALR